jgi:hypothetical protein
MEVVIAIAAAFFLLSGVCKAITNTLDHHFDNSPFDDFNPLFWNPRISWKNKYKNDMRTPKFWGSTTFLAWTTDAWHLLDMLHLTFLQFPFALLSSFNFGNYWLSIPILFGIKFVCGISFQPLYKRWS